MPKGEDTSRDPRNLQKMERLNAVVAEWVKEHLRRDFTGPLTVTINLKEGFIQESWKGNGEKHGRL